MPAFSIKLIFRSMISMPNLKSGIPKRTNPPIFSSRSYTVTLWPALFNCSAAAKPAGPDPIMAIFFPVRAVGVLGLAYPLR